MTFKYVKPAIVERETGYTVKAIERKMEEGTFREGHEYIVAPDGKRLIVVEGFNKWAESRQRGV